MYHTHGATQTAEVLDDIKASDINISTSAGYDSIHFRYDSADAKKPRCLQERRNSRPITEQYKRGLITEEERYKAVVETWKADR